MVSLMANRCDATRRSPAGQLKSLDHLLATRAAERAYPMTVAELCRWAEHSLELE